MSAPLSPPAPQFQQPPPNNTQVIIYQQGWLARLWSWAGWIGLAICSMILIGQWLALADYFDTTEGIEERFVQGEELASDKVAVLSIEGVIMQGDGFVKQQIDHISEDDNVKAIVVRVDSPGGTVTGSDYIYHHLAKLRNEKGIPLVVSMGSIAASGGYYVSMAVGDQENVIYAEPTTTTGSIGVIIPHYDLSGLLAEYKVKDDSIATHERKQMLAMTRPIPDEHREIIKKHLDAMFTRFKSIIKEGRPKFAADGAALDQLATGEVFTTDQAIENGLVDKVGFVEDAIDRALELAKLDKDKTRVVRYRRPADLLSVFGAAQARQQTAFNLPQLLELASPRGWYLATSLPAIATSRRAD
ncbi:MAG: signal peptide peptidase SppA [Planctomycetaceae bacterium]|nr:signal peptide peptidase SppA [Planctomycetaceae bacterium]